MKNIDKDKIIETAQKGAEKVSQGVEKVHEMVNEKVSDAAKKKIRDKENVLGSFGSGIVITAAIVLVIALLKHMDIVFYAVIVGLVVFSPQILRAVKAYQAGKAEKEKQALLSKPEQAAVVDESAEVKKEE